MLPAVGTIATNRTTLTFRELKEKIHQLLDYAATHPEPFLQYCASQMYLWAHSDASYLSESKARSRAGGYYFLSSKPTFPIKATYPQPRRNTPILVLSKIIDAVMSSAQEAKTGAGFINARELIPLRNALCEMGHPQGPTPIQFDNRVANDILNDDVNQKRSKAMDMRFYWLRDRIRQKQFHAFWRRGTDNYADYPTKHHHTKNHINVRPYYVSNAVIKKNYWKVRTSKKDTCYRQGCAKVCITADFK